MRVLLVNDDGVFARGIGALALAFSGAGHEVWVCAPDRERSAASHSVTILEPLRTREVSLPGARRAWAATGTPADCAQLGLFLTRDAGIDLVVTGINRGMNMGGACVYSGTVAAALEAAMAGAQALAVSLCVRSHEGEDREDYGPAARLALRVAAWLWTHPLDRGVILNLNVPAIPEGEIRGLVAAKLSPVFLQTPNYEHTADGYRYVGGPGLPLDDPETDLYRVNHSFATLTRLTWDFRLNAPDDDLNGIPAAD